MNESMIVDDLLERGFQRVQEDIDAVLFTGHGAMLTDRLDGRHTGEIGDATARNHAIGKHPGQHAECLFRLLATVSQLGLAMRPDLQNRVAATEPRDAALQPLPFLGAWRQTGHATPQQ